MRALALLFLAASLGWPVLIADQVWSHSYLVAVAVPGNAGHIVQYDFNWLFWAGVLCALGLLIALVGVARRRTGANLALGSVLLAGLVGVLHSGVELHVGFDFFHGDGSGDGIDPVVRLEGPFVTRALVELDTVTRVERIEGDQLLFVHENGGRDALALRGLLARGQDEVIAYCAEIGIEVLERE